MRKFSALLHHKISVRQLPHLANIFSGSQNTEATAKTTSKPLSVPGAWVNTNIESYETTQLSIATRVTVNDCPDLELFDRPDSQS